MLFILNLNNIAMNDTVKERLIAFIKSKDMSQGKFEKSVGLSNGFVNNISKGIGAAKLQRILSVYPDLNQSWLINGEGCMVNDPDFEGDESGLDKWDNVDLKTAKYKLKVILDSFLLDDESKKQLYLSDEFWSDESPIPLPIREFIHKYPIYEKYVLEHVDVLEDLIEKKEIKNNDIVIYHYTSVKNLISILTERVLLFGDNKHSNDYREQSLQNKKERFVSFCMGDDLLEGYRKPRMWAQYGKNSSGVCIGIKLKELIKLNPGIDNYPITYVPNYFNYWTMSFKEPFRYKTIDWKEESEYRFVASGKYGLKINEGCVEHIIAGVNIEKEAVDTLRKINGFVVKGIKKDLAFRLGDVTVMGSRMFYDLNDEHIPAERKYNPSNEMKAGKLINYYENRVEGAIPYYEDLLVSAGQMDLARIQNWEKPSGWVKLPEVFSAIGAFPVIGCSMEPDIHAGDFIAVSPIESWEVIDPDKIYMIITRDDRMIKHLAADNDDPDILWCISPNYPKFKVLKSDVVSILKITFHGRIM